MIVWADNGGIVGRGVLLDYATWAEAKGKPVNCFEAQSIPLDDLLEVAASQKTTFRPGDILFIRTGWTRAYEKLSQTECEQLANYAAPPVIGVKSSEAILRWIWESGFAAVAGDQPAFEAYPCQDSDFFLHEWLLAGWGLPIGELFDLERLGRECRQRGRYTFFFSSVPLKVRSYMDILQLLGFSFLLICANQMNRSLGEWRALRTGWLFSELDELMYQLSFRGDRPCGNTRTQLISSVKPVKVFISSTEYGVHRSTLQVVDIVSRDPPPIGPKIRKCGGDNNFTSSNLLGVT
jgi:hypothetical protein